jgi:hypothetical protein
VRKIKRQQVIDLIVLLCAAHKQNNYKKLKQKLSGMELAELKKLLQKIYNQINNVFELEKLKH